MRFRFLCDKHQVDLTGFPAWSLSSVDPDVYEISFKGFTCSEGEEEEERICIPIEDFIIMESVQ